MEMIDVLKKLQEIAETKPELVKDAVDNVQRTNPKVDEGAMKDYLHSEAEKLSREEFLKKHGESLRGFYNAIMGSEDDDDDRPDSMEGKEMKKEKETVKEAIQISTDSPEEASMMMQILKLAGVQQVTPDMMGMDKPEMDPGDMNKKMDVPSDDAMGSMQMAKMRDMMTKPDEEKAEETFANSMGDEKEEPKYQDTDTLVNVHSGGLGAQRKQYRKDYPGDNPMAVKEDTITEEDLANSLRTQYEDFKAQYQEAAKPDFLDMDKDGNKTEPMKKAVKDKEEKEKK
jgi:hypothetical protein|tara:strand:+ start:1974 stop:2828 length:855 start_codon:yes stop_codon:yes gene_type:complete